MTTMPRVPGWRKVLDWAVTIGVALLLVLVFEAEVAKPYRIPSSSMEPTLHCAKPGAWCEGRFNDRVIANRLAYRFASPKRGQIVVFQAPSRTPAGSAARSSNVSSACPETRCRSGTAIVSINGKPLHEPYVDPKLRDTDTNTWQVPAGRYFFMGDDRVHSCDSRMWGAVPKSSLVGPVLLTYWPPTSWF